MIESRLYMLKNTLLVVIIFTMSIILNTNFVYATNDITNNINGATFFILHF